MAQQSCDCAMSFHYLPLKKVHTQTAPEHIILEQIALEYVSDFNVNNKIRKNKKEIFE
jgi:hypothetical protein